MKLLKALGGLYIHQLKQAEVEVTVSKDCTDLTDNLVLHRQAKLRQDVGP